ncbi:nitrilase family protein [Nonlabens sp. Ci31]|jgi:predicted amidohydrolase|uniref:nitrilase family protein n=1 Tax=Nonlabens sp. Ci31 TaxID=2608253 RepID=UPI001463BAA3|nr:nitrilase family protein [Nonlabens sp. Ci31]QJP33644.1 nitrilase family protein [Nonlabens sp. Ci31]
MKKNNLKISLIQSSLAWEDPKENLDRFSEKLETLYGKSDLVVLPEMFTTGFSMKPKGLACDSGILDYLKDHCIKGGFAIYGSVMFQEADHFVNRGVFMRPDGSSAIYDKRHTFTLAGEHKVYQRGEQPVIAAYLGWKFNLQICYDLRFPVFARNTQDYDVVIYVANWPVPRINAWDALLKARAIENMSYAIGVNRVGTDGTGMDYNGHSQIYNVLGHELLTHPWETEGIETVEIHKSEIEHNRSKLPFLEDRDEFTLN